MRITGGEFGGRILKVPKSDAIRPTQDRVREALFNIIQFEVPGADFLDLFAGSGAVGIEALSRGAKSATFVEQDRRHFSVLGENVGMVSCAPGQYAADKPFNFSTFQLFNRPCRRLSLDRVLFRAWLFDCVCRSAVCAWRGEGLCERPRDACRSRGGASGRAIRRRDDGGPEGRGDARLGACPRPDLRQDPPMPLAAPRCGVKKKAFGDCRRPFSHLTAMRVTRPSDWLRSGFRRAWNPCT